MFEFPILTGEYSVGITTRHVIDQNRKEPYNLNAQRELMVYLWYPAQSNKKNPLVVYRADEIEETKSSLKHAGFPEQDLKEFDMIYSHAMPNALIFRKKAPYPVILFSHGYLGCLPVNYTAFCEELASHGYIIASIAHTYYAQKVTFPDGRQITPPSEIATQNPFPDPKVQAMWAADVQSVLDHLIKMNANTHDSFNNCFDVNRIGIVGHSMGGATAFRLCLNDPRFKAGVSFDASPWSQDKPPADLKKPFLFIFAEKTVEESKKSDVALAKTYGITIEEVKKCRNLDQREIRADVVIPNILHAGFSDYLLIKDLPLFRKNKHILDLEAISGTANGRKTIQYINKKIVEFFRKNL